MSLSAASSQTVTGEYATGDGTATAAGGDYVASSGSLSFAPGVTVQTITVLITGDVVAEPNEAFGVTLRNAVNATIAKSQGTGTIINDDSVTMSISDVTVTEGNNGTVNAVFTVSLSAASSQSGAVEYATGDGTATAGTDFVAKSGSLSFTPGMTVQTITMLVNGQP